MKAVVFYAHPNPKSFNAAILDVVKKELTEKVAEVKVKDLYAMNWNPVLSASDIQQVMSGQMPADVAAEQEDITWADTLVFVCPIWWYTFPAILKGYVDRVFSSGFAYEYTASGAHGKLQGKKALIVTTSGADEATARMTKMMDSINISLMSGLCGFTGLDNAKYMNCFAVPSVSDAERKQILVDVRSFVAKNV
jgi:NAD(P)H dehydrogenase (quinone)